jgi:hypothetical protein
MTIVGTPVVEGVGVDACSGASWPNGTEANSTSTGHPSGYPFVWAG